MSQFNQKNTRSLSQLPRVTLITCGYKDIKQTYQNIDHIIIEDTPINTFNQGLQTATNIWCAFLDESFDFTDETVIEQIMTIAAKHSEISGVYTDNIVNNVRNYYPSFDLTIPNSNLVINTPIFFNKNVGITFETDNYYANAIQKLSQQIILHHIPQALFIKNEQSD